LEIVDSKAMLVFVLTLAAEIAISRGETERGRELAERARLGAEAIGKASARILAHVALGRASAEAESHLAAARALIDHPYGISRRARDAVSRLAADFNAGANADSRAGSLRRARR
jgi:hypothetical protein